MGRTLAALAALSLAVVFGTSVQAQTPGEVNLNPIGVDPEHYQCYTIKAGSFLKDVTLKDQFDKEDEPARIGKPTFLCAPVSKNKERVADEKTHLVCYQVLEPKPLQPQPQVEVKNQFGKFRLVVDTPRVLCVPSVKRVLSRTD